MSILGMSTIRFARRLGRAEGQATVEFVFIFPIFVLLLMLIVEFGLGLYKYQVITNSAREGARRAAVENGSTVADITATIQQRLNQGGVQWTNSSANTNYCDPALPNTQVAIGGLEIYGCRWEPSPQALRVAIRYGYELAFFGHFYSLAAGARTIPLSTDFWMRHE
jgi:hypothetical protein